jgi:hypothetical protein
MVLGLARIEHLLLPHMSRFTYLSLDIEPYARREIQPQCLRKGA